MQLTRRQFNQIGLGALSAAGAMPLWLTQPAAAANAESCLPDGRILVVLYQEGGNDGINTVIPRTDPIYYDDAIRPRLRVPSGAEIVIDGLNGFHPRLSRLANRYQQGLVSIVQNVGYPNTHFSHFVSQEHWELGYAPGEPILTQGWLARLHDAICMGGGDPDPLFMVGSHLDKVPLTLQGTTGYTAPAVGDPEHYALTANADESLRLATINQLNSIATADSVIDHLQRSEIAAQASATDIATALEQPDLLPPGSYPEGDLGDGLKLVSQIIRAGLSTQIFFVKQGGYDTHANQVNPANPLHWGTHPELLADFDLAVDSFLAEMDLSGNMDRVLVLTFSEFGRRVLDNVSNGSDHGAGSCLFAMGGPVIGGIYGGQPDLANLIDNNQPHSIDFRTVYARVIEGWFGKSSADVFGSSIHSSIIEPQLASIPFLPQTPALTAGLMMR